MLIINEVVKIYIIEGNPEKVKLIKDYLKETNEIHFILSNSSTLKNAIKDLKSNNYDAILLNLNLPDSSGKNTVYEILKVSKDIPIILLISGTEDSEVMNNIKEDIQDHIDEVYLNNYTLTKAIRYAIERKNHEIKIKALEEEWDNTFNSMFDAVSVQDKDRNLIKVNKAFIDLVQMSESELINTPCNRVIHEDGEQPGDCPHVGAFKTKKVVIEEFFEPKLKRHFLFTVSPIFDKNNEINHVVHVMTDITKLKNTIKDLTESEQNYRLAFNRAEFYKDLFTHDINNILHGILFGIEYNQSLSENLGESIKIKENLELIKKEVTRGAKLINNIKKLTDLEETQKIISKIDVIKLLNDCIDNIRNKYKDKEIVIEKTAFKNKIYVRANEQLIDIFQNVLSNSILHNINPIININIEISEVKKENKDYIKFEFKDNGIGIDESDKNRIFQRGKYNYRSTYGRGTGLLLLKNIIDSFEGQIWIEDRIKDDYSKGINLIFLIPEVKSLDG